MGRFPDFCAQLTVGMIEIADDLGKADPRFGQNALAYHRYCASRDLCLTHALNDQYYDRSKRVLDQEDPDLCLHVVRETAEGMVVRGMRNLATLAPRRLARPRALAGSLHCLGAPAPRLGGPPLLRQVL